MTIYIIAVIFTFWSVLGYVVLFLQCLQFISFLPVGKIFIDPADVSCISIFIFENENLSALLWDVLLNMYLLVKYAVSV